MLKVMLNARLRASEVLNLEPGHINLNSGKLIVKEGKGKKDRVLWLGEKDLEMTGKWKEKRPGSKFLFCTLHGKKLNDRYLRQLIKRLARKAGINKYISPHTLRHSFATDL